MTYESINYILGEHYKKTGEEPTYLILPIDDFYNFTSNYEIGTYENILTISTNYGIIYLEGKDTVHEPIIIA